MPSTVRCPGCSTRFCVASEQLDSANGWVRCGVCEQVFDAARQMVADDALPANQSLRDRHVVPPRPAGGDPPVEAAAPLLRQASSDAPDSEWTAATEFFETRRNPHAGDIGGRTAWPQTTRDGLAATSRVAMRAELHSASSADSAQHALSFMRGARGDDRRATRSLRWLGNVAVLLLVGVLLGQVALQHRDWLAARAPAFKPLLQRLCDRLGCTVGPPRQIEALVIGNSSLTKLGESGFRLSLALRNQSDTDIATPSIELTLTDAADRTLVRRVLMPADLGAVERLVARGEWTGALTFALADSRERIAGYRVTAFYP